MRGSIRSQILAPILGIQVATVISIAVATATLLARRSELEIVARLNGVMETLDRANFPYTPGVLTKLRGLSGAHFAVLASDGSVAATTLPGPVALPPQLRTLPPLDRFDSLRGLTTLTIDRTRYYAAPLCPADGSRATSLLLLYPETNWRQARWDAAMPPLGLGLGTIALMGAVTSWTARRIGIRLRHVQGQVARVAAGDFTRFDPGTRRDEVQELARSVNQMCDQLSRLQQIIRQSERTRLLSQIAAGLAHQLRNSLTGARMSIQLHARRFPPHAGDETLDVALRQLAMTEEQVKGLLSLGQAESRRRSACDLGRLLAEVSVLVNSSCQHAGVSLRCLPGPGSILLLGDEAGLRSAILNLTLNAIEAATPGGRVELVLVASAGEVSIEVSDDGSGPPAEIAATLLEAFVTSKPEGVGLGLAVASQVARGHGGQLSWRRGDGLTRFRLTFAREAR